MTEAIITFQMNRILITEYPLIGWHAFQRAKALAKCDIFREIFGKIHNNSIYLIAKCMPLIFVSLAHKHLISLALQFDLDAEKTIFALLDRQKLSKSMISLFNKFKRFESVNFCREKNTEHLIQLSAFWEEK